MSEPHRKLRILIACGGTGGHLFPGIAVAQEARSRGHECLVLISEKQIDALATQGHADLKFAKLPAIAMPPVFSLRIFKFGLRMWRAVRACKKIIADFEADLVLGMGGFTSLAPLYAGKRKKLPTLVHESNAYPGKANKLAAKFCRFVLLGLADCAQHFPSGKCRVVGTPLRAQLRQTVDPAAAWEFFGLQPGKKVVLVMGGSQGAKGVNGNVLAALPSLDPSQYQIIHLTGPQDFANVKKAYDGQPIAAHVAPFCQRMELAYAITTVAISRAGASSLTELSAFGIPSILIPFPFAADDHQTKNAEVFVREKAALMVQERDLNGARLASLIQDLSTDEPVRASISAKMLRMGAVNAAERVCDELEKCHSQYSQ